MLNVMLPFYKLSNTIIAGAASLSLLYQATPLHAQPTKADFSLGRGFICNTAQEVEAVATPDENKILENVADVNSRFGKNSCTFATALFRSSGENKLSLIDGGVKIERVELVGYLVGDDLKPLPQPIEQFFGTADHAPGV
jgi:hypothetical protein